MDGYGYRNTVRGMGPRRAVPVLQDVGKWILAGRVAYYHYKIIQLHTIITIVNVGKRDFRCLVHEQSIFVVQIFFPGKVWTVTIVSAHLEVLKTK